jgi:hypothetical protein
MFVGHATKIQPQIAELNNCGRLPKFGERRMIGDPLEHLAELILQDRGHSLVFPPPGFTHHFPERL